MPTVKGTTFTAPRCRIMMDGKTIGRGTNVSYTSETEYQPIEQIDSIEVVEWAPVGYRVTGSISQIGMVGTTPKSQGMFPATGKTSDEHLLNILLHGEKTLVLMDKPEKRNLVILYRVVFSTHGFSLAARGVAGRDVQFQAVRETDESEAST